MSLLDLGPATRRTAALVEAVPDELLGGPTPCTDTTVGDLLDHIGGLALAFTAAARKDLEIGSSAPSPDGSRLGGDWRTRIPRDLGSLAEAWRDPEAWSGVTRAGGIDMPGEIAGVVALDEVVLHGWDLARSIDRPYDCDEEALEAVHGFVSQMADPAQASARQGLFGPVVDVADSSGLLDRVLGLAGRDPAWSPR